MDDAEHTSPPCAILCCAEELTKQQSLSLRLSAPVGFSGFAFLLLEFGKIASLSPREKFCFNPSLPLFICEIPVQKAGRKLGSKRSLQK